MSASCGNCKSCKHWVKPDGDSYAITNPVDPDTYQPMVMPFEVRECVHPKLVFCERPVETPGFAVADGSMYRAGLYTTEDFGCVMYEAKS